MRQSFFLDNFITMTATEVNYFLYKYKKLDTLEPDIKILKVNSSDINAKLTVFFGERTIKYTIPVSRCGLDLYHLYRILKKSRGGLDVYNNIYLHPKQ